VDKETKNEEDLLKSLKDIITENRQGLVVCGIFATNISRIISIAIAAKSCGRKIGIIGTSIYKTLKVASEMKYIPRNIEFVTENEFSKCNRKNLLLIATGCQGQENSGLGKLADGSYKNIKLQKNDTVIFSSSEIPGNESEINTLYNKLAKLDVNIINSRNAFVHLSGHYTKGELEEMYRLVNPKIAIAVHGTNMQLIEHKKVAEKLGIKSVIEGEDGTIFKIGSNGKIEALHKIKITNSIVDGNRIILSDGDIINERIRLSNAGIIIVSMVVDRNYKLISPIDIVAVGNYNLLSERVVRELLKESATKSYKNARLSIDNPENASIFDTDQKKEIKIEKDIKKSIQDFVFQNMKKTPFVVIKMLKETKELIRCNKT
jgi:ribonuclease J